MHKEANSYTKDYEKNDSGVNVNISKNRIAGF